MSTKTRLDRLEKKVKPKPVTPKITTIEVLGDRGQGTELIKRWKWNGKSYVSQAAK